MFNELLSESNGDPLVRDVDNQDEGVVELSQSRAICILAVLLS